MKIVPLTLWKAVQMFYDGVSMDEVAHDLDLPPELVEDAVRLAMIVADQVRRWEEEE